LITPLWVVALVAATHAYRFVRGLPDGFVLSIDREREYPTPVLSEDEKLQVAALVSGAEVLDDCETSLTTRVMLVALPNGHTADLVADALASKVVELPDQLRRSLTWDQGKEMAAHARFSVATDVPVYFCDPRSPWQRGSNENTNGLLRQYFPKRSEIALYPQADLDKVAAELNDRPRQTLGWRSPSQALDDALR
jgi:IS30 family transposase